MPDTLPKILSSHFVRYMWDSNIQSVVYQYRSSSLASLSLYKSCNEPLPLLIPPLRDFNPTLGLILTGLTFQHLADVSYKICSVQRGGVVDLRLCTSFKNIHDVQPPEPFPLTTSGSTMTHSAGRCQETGALHRQKANEHHRDYQTNKYQSLHGMKFCF